MKKFWLCLKKHKILTSCVVVVLVAICTMSWVWALVFTRYSKGTVPTDADLAGAVRYERVVIIGVDGAGGWFGKQNVPNFHRVFDEGSVTYTGWSQYPTTSAHNWTSMLHGVRYQKHKINNEVASKKAYADEKYPSVFKIYAQRHEGAQFLSACSWDPINIGIVEDVPGLIKISGEEGMADPHKEDPFAKIADEKVLTGFLKKIGDPSFDPAIAFVHFNQVDEYGHKYGSIAKEYGESIEFVDGYIGRIYDAYCARGWENDTLFILASDHGHRITKGHGMNTKREREVTVAVSGKLGNVAKGTPGKVVTQDVAAITLYALGEKQPDNWDARIPENMFNTL